MMKRCLILCLVAILLMGCQADPPEQAEGHSFYYPRVQILYGSEEGVIAPEIRNDITMGQDLLTIIDTYLKGPLSEELYSPFPEGTRPTRAELKGNALYICLTDPFFALKDMKMTLACTALSQTCFSLTDAQFLVILRPDGKNYRILRRDTMFFHDAHDALDMDIGTEPITEE